MKNAQAMIVEGRCKDFYHLLIKTLNNFLADKLHRPSASLSIAEIMLLMQQKGFSKEVIDNIRTVFEYADQVQFASLKVDSTRMDEDLAKVSSIIAYLEKKL